MGGVYSPPYTGDNMYKKDITLNEPNDDEIFVLRQGDSPLFKLTVYDHDGTAWPAGYTGYLRIGRSNRDYDIWILTGIPGDDDNEWYFQLEDVTYTIGDYDAILYLIAPDATTPEVPDEIFDTTPVEDDYTSEMDYTFLPIPIEVR